MTHPGNAESNSIQKVFEQYRALSTPVARTLFCKFTFEYDHSERITQYLFLCN